MSREDDLPSWDEFGAEQLDYGEDDDGEVTAPPGDDPGDPGEEPSCSSSSVSSSVMVHAPVAPSAPSSSNRAVTGAVRNIGPSLPPGFDIGGGAEDVDDENDEDPEDPGDPSMQQPSGDEAELAPTLPSVGGPSLPIDEPAAAPPAAAAPPSLAAARRVSTGSYGPAAPPPEPEPQVRLARRPVAVAPSARAVIGPAVPPDLLPFEANGGFEQEADEDEMSARKEPEEEEEEEEEDAYGPALPPGMQNGGGDAMHAVATTGGEMEMPSIDEEDDDDDVVGPMPARADGSEERAAEARRAYLRAEKEREDKKVKREEWMLQLPKKLNSYGLGPRSFSKSNGTDGDSSAWTNGPGTSSSSDQPGTSADAMQKMANAERDAAQARIASSLNAGRNESMLDSHSRKRKAGEEEVAGPSAPTVRRPFDIEKDMQVRGLKSASTAEIKEKCGQLSSRFGNSGSQKYL